MPRNLELEAAILAAPDDEQAYLVYADWLQQHGDPRGELAMLQAAGQHEQAEASLARGELGGLPVDASWRLGWLQRVQITAEVPRVYEVLLAMDSARFLRELAVGQPGTAILRGNPTLLATMTRLGVPFPLRRLVLAEEPGGDEPGAPWDRLAGLEELEVERFYTPLRDLALPALRWLVLHGDASEEDLAELAHARLPRVERIALGLAKTEGTDGLVALLASRTMPSLCKLALNEAPAGQRIAEVLARSPLLPQLQRLALPRGQLDDAEGELFLEHRAAFAHLRSLDLRGNYFNREMCARLAGLCSVVILDRQLPGEP